MSEFSIKPRPLFGCHLYLLMCHESWSSSRTNKLTYLLSLGPVTTTKLSSTSRGHLFMQKPQTNKKYTHHLSIKANTKKEHRSLIHFVSFQSISK
jgi:hypothetical protein